MHITMKFYLPLLQEKFPTKDKSNTMGHNYYFLDKNNRRVGPLTETELKKLNLPGSTYVWHEGLPSWTTLSSLYSAPQAKTGFLQKLSIPLIILMVYAFFGTLFALLVGRFVFAFLSASIYRHVDELPWFALLLFTLLFLPFLFYKKRRYWLHALLAIFPFWTGSLFAGIYYRAICDAHTFHDGYCVIEKPGGTGVINRWGLECVPCIYESVTPNSVFDPTFCTVFADGKAGTCDMEGNTLIPCEWKYIIRDYDYNLWRVSDDGSCWGLLRDDGTPLLPCKYDRISYSGREIHAQRGNATDCFDHEGNFLTSY